MGDHAAQRDRWRHCAGRASTARKSAWTSGVGTTLDELCSRTIRQFHSRCKAAILSLAYEHEAVRCVPAASAVGTSELALVNSVARIAAWVGDIGISFRAEWRDGME
jgi:hypothetical protein